MNCPVCGTENPAGSKFCNNCGAGLLPDSGQVCPNCQAHNPEDRPFCERCGAALAATDLPQEETASTASEIPDWLADLETESTPEGGETAPADREQKSTAAEETEDAPAWLADVEADTDEPAEIEISDRVSQQPEETVPAWLADLEAEESEREETAEPEDAIPSWLADVEAAPEELESDLEEEADKWLADLDPDADIDAVSPESDDEFAGWLSEWNDREEAETSWEEDSDEMPSGSIADLEATPEKRETPLDPPTGAGKEWLSENDVSEDIAGEREEPSAERRKTSLDWLADQPPEPPADVSTQTSEGAAEAATDHAAADGWDEETLPDWLNELAGVTDERDTGPTPEGTADGEAEIPVEDGVPRREEPAEDSPVAAEDAPDWLADLPTQEAEATVDEEEMLDWLREEGEEAVTTETERADETLESPAAEEAPDWLDDLPTQEAEATVDEEEMPDWLRDAGEKAVPTEVEEPDEPLEPQDVEVDDFSDPESEEEPEETSDETKEKPGVAGIPAWLAGTEVAPTEPAPPASTEPPDAPTDDDDWLQAMREADDDEQLAPEPTPPAETPEWLRQMAPPDTGSLIPQEDTEYILEDAGDLPDGQEGAEEMPAWSEGEDAAAQESGGDDLILDAAQGPEQTVEEEPFPDLWSDEEFDDEVAETAESEKAQAEERLPDEEIDEPLVPREDLPDWLGDVMADIGEPESFMFEEEEEGEEPFSAGDQSPDRAEEGEAEPTPPEEMPEWLRPPTGMESGSFPEDEEPDYLPEELFSPEGSERELSEVEIPEWIQSLQSGEPGQESEDALGQESHEPLVTVGPLAGLRGVIEIEPAVAEPRTAEWAGKDEISDEPQGQAALLRQVVTSAPQVTIPMAAEQVGAGSPLVRAVLSVLLLAAALIGLFYADLLDVPVPAPADLDEAGALVAEAAPRPVLVAFDYTPAMAGALDAHASHLLTRLAESGSPVLFVSQSAAGLALADQKAASIPDLRSRRLGYLPGNATGLRRLAPCLQSQSTCESIFGAPLDEELTTGLAESALLIVLAGDRESAVNWIEQVVATTDKPMLAVVPQAVEPVIAPYHSNGQVAGLLSTSPPAITPRQGDDAPTAEASPAAATALAQWLAIALLLVGNLYFLVRGAWQGAGRSEPGSAA